MSPTSYLCLPAATCLHVANCLPLATSVSKQLLVSPSSYFRLSQLLLSPSKFFCFPLPVQFRQCFLLIAISKLLYHPTCSPVTTPTDLPWSYIKSLQFEPTNAVDFIKSAVIPEHAGCYMFPSLLAPSSVCTQQWLKHFLHVSELPWSPKCSTSVYCSRQIRALKTTELKFKTLSGQFWYVQKMLCTFVCTPMMGPARTETCSSQRVPVLKHF